MNDLKYLGRFKGSVIKWDVEKSYGFIRITESVEGVKSTYKDDAFIYFRDVEPDKDGLKKLHQAQIVEFDLNRGPKGLVAKNLNILGDRYDDHGEINGNIR